MTGSARPSEFVPLREYVEALFTEREKAVEAALAAQEKAVTAALDASDKAITKAEGNAEKWRENANEWRGAMSDRDRQLPSRREVEQATKALDARLATVERAIQSEQGRSSGTNAAIGYVIGAAGVLTAIVAVIASQL